MPQSTCVHLRLEVSARYVVPSEPAIEPPCTAHNQRYDAIVTSSVSASGATALTRWEGEFTMKNSTPLIVGTPHLLHYAGPIAARTVRTLNAVLGLEVTGSRSNTVGRGGGGLGYTIC